VGLEWNVLQEEKHFILNTWSVFIVSDILLQYCTSCKYALQMMIIGWIHWLTPNWETLHYFPKCFIWNLGPFLLGFSHLAHLTLLVRYHTVYIYISLSPRAVWYGERGSQDILSKREIALWRKDAARSPVNSFHVNLLLILQIFMPWEVLSTQQEKFLSYVNVAIRRHCDGLPSPSSKKYRPILAIGDSAHWRVTLVSCTGHAWESMKIFSCQTSKVLLTHITA
jgi:hypothetical protein